MFNDLTIAKMKAVNNDKKTDVNLIELIELLLIVLLLIELSLVE